MTDSPRPEPVLNLVRLGAIVSAAVVAVGGVIALVASGQWSDLNALGKAVGGAVVAVGTLIAYLAPMVQARRARALVTPLSDPILDDPDEHTAETLGSSGRSVQSILDDEASRSDPA